MRRRSVHVGEIQFVGNRGVDRVAQRRVRRKRRLETKLNGTQRRGGDRQQESRRSPARADQQHGRAAEMRQRRAAERVRFRSAVRRQMDAAQQFARRQERSHVLPVTKSTRRQRGAVAFARPQLVHAFERGRQRDHRSGGQRHHDVAADRRLVPNLERREKRAAALADQRGRDPRFGRVRMRRVRRSGRLRRFPSRRRARVSDGQRERLEIDQRVRVDLRLGEQPRAAGQPRVTGAPALDFVERCGRLTS